MPKIEDNPRLQSYNQISFSSQSDTSRHLLYKSIPIDDSLIVDLITYFVQEIDYPSCEQSDLQVLSILGPEEFDQYPTFESLPHFCGTKNGLISDVADFDQYGEKEWRLIQKTKAQGVKSYAAFSFSVRKSATSNAIFNTYVIILR